ncbi:hypothetical protein RJT34_12187 [Clitoria ternatea]|uniref:Uncharacterized protein n=1 Tax=Clitoria ternatea TaxID=43366 RepID=A0AAN9PK89_CLITE
MPMIKSNTSVDFSPRLTAHDPSPDTSTRAMTMKESPKPKPFKSSPKIKSPRCMYLKPGALAKLRDSKISAEHASRTTQNISVSQLLLSPSTPTQHEEQALNQDNGIPCFDSSTVNPNRPRCLRSKKLLAVSPTFTLPDTHQF